ncbi:MAG: RES family NAD+ phosphorylase [Candidatus Eremiobacteraeota bacterium]|nr:RES family NAD+ phosphorylase [Candidatus Eremiobacteraeota bacterium]
MHTQPLGTRKLYRVFPWNSNAADHQSGGALFVVDSNKNRISNVELYRTFYLAAQPEAALAEVLGHLLIWRPKTFVHSVGPLSLATYELPESLPIFELDDLNAIRSLGIEQPSRIVTRDRTITRGWARTIYERGTYAGARWWSYHNPDWQAYGLWNIDALSLNVPPTPLSTGSPIVISTAKAIAKQILRA